jgi:uncharacterized phage-associated protein
MKYPSLNVASHIANVCEAQNINYNNTKIQKLMYCCYGCVLAVHNERLCDEYPRAWQFGPVFPRVFTYISKGRNILSVCPRLDAPTNVLDLIGNVLNTFGRYSANVLSKWTHTEGSPWDIVINDMGDRNGIIPDDLITEYFREYVVRDAENA